MKILMISNIDADEKLEDIWLARAFQKEGHKVAIVDKNYDERLESLYDVFLLRNTCDTNATIETIKEKSNFRKRVINKNLPRINFDGIGQIVVDKQQLEKKFTNLYIIHPYMEFQSEVQFII